MYYDINYLTGVITILEDPIVVIKEVYLDTDKESSGDGTSLANAYHTLANVITNELTNKDLPTLNTRVIIYVYGDTKITATATLPATLVTDSNCYVHFKGMENTLMEITNGTAWTVNAHFIVWENIKVHMIGNNTTYKNGFIFNNIAGNASWTFLRCLIYATLTGTTNNVYGIRSVDSTNTKRINFINSIITGFNLGAASQALNIAAPVLCNIVNSIVDNNISGYGSAYGTQTRIRNSIFTRNTDSIAIYSGTIIDSDYNIFHNTETTGGVHDLTEQTVTYEDVDTLDFRLAKTSPAFDVGDDLSGDSYYPFSNDYLGNNRPSGTEWDRGAYELQVYTVTYNGNGNTGGVIPVDNTYYAETEEVTILDNTGSLEKTGYTFSKWNTAANGSGTNYNPADTFAMVTANIILYAQWEETEYTITYNLDGGTNNPSNPETYTYNTATVILEDPTKSGYTFDGWYTEAEFENEVTEITLHSTGNKEFFAKWVENIPSEKTIWKKLFKGSCWRKNR